MSRETSDVTIVGCREILHRCKCLVRLVENILICSYSKRNTTDRYNAVGFGKAIPQHVDQPQAGEIFVGRGNTDSDLLEGIAIDWKTCIHGGNGSGNRRFKSITRLVVEIEPEKVTHWQSCIPDCDVSKAVIFIEDFSPDTCVGFIFFYCRLNDVGEFPENWIEYIDGWEQGRVGAQRDPRRSFGCLISALGHSYWDGEPDGEESSNRLHTGFVTCVSFAARLIALGADPDDIDPSWVDQVPELALALALVEQERQLYLQTLGHAEKIQLYLPMKGTTRRLLVDALLTSENRLAGLFKVFLRRDTENSWLGGGFPFLAIHRPNLAGTGNDTVISVPPDLGVTLSGLHQALERAENLAWNGQRPNGHPRSGFDCNEPWYVTPDATLVAAPRWIDRAAGILGTRLDWHTNVVAVVWQLYSPLKDVKVRPFTEAEHVADVSVSFDECPPLRNAYGKRLLVVVWDDADENNSLILSPTALRYMAACVIKPLDGQVELKDLPPESSFDVLKVSGGLALIHDHGVLILDDWTREPIDVPMFVEEFDRVVRRHQAIEEHTVLVEERFKELRRRFEPGQRLESEFISGIMGFSARQKVLVREVIFSTMPLAGSFDRNQFRAKLESRWGLGSQLDDLYEALTELETIARSAIEERTNRVITAVTVFGYPPFMLAGLFAFIFQPGGNQTGDDYFSFGFLKLHWIGFITYLVASFGLILVLRWLMKRR